MDEVVRVGDAAPDFDLSSTEGALLMLRDEVSRSAVVLYFFSDPDAERVRHDLLTLAARRPELVRKHAKILAVSTLKMPQLNALQAELSLPFPLLRDDRDFSARYGVVAADDESPAPALVLVNRKQKVLWLANPVTSVESAMPQVEKALQGQDSPASNYPKSVVNRWVDRWVN